MIFWNAPTCYRAARWPDTEYPQKMPKKSTLRAESLEYWKNGHFCYFGDYFSSVFEVFGGIFWEPRIPEGPCDRKTKSRSKISMLACKFQSRSKISTLARKFQSHCFYLWGPPPVQRRARSKFQSTIDRRKFQSRRLRSFFFNPQALCALRA